MMPCKNKSEILYKKQSGTQREKKHVLTLTLMLVRRKSACKTSAGSSKILRWLTPLLGPNLDPKTGPKQRPKRRNENVIQFWTPFWGPYLDPKMGSAIGEFRCCPHMLCKQICDPAAWTWMSTHTFFLFVRPKSGCYCQGPFIAAMFWPLFWALFQGPWWSRFVGIRVAPRPTEACPRHEDKARLTGTRIYILWGYAHASPQNCLFWGPGFGTSFCSILLTLPPPLLATYMGEGFGGSRFRVLYGGEIYCRFWCASWTTSSSSAKRCDRHLNCVALACRCNSSLFSDAGPLETIAENKTEQKSAAKRRQRLLKAPQQPPS